MTPSGCWTGGKSVVRDEKRTPSKLERREKEKTAKQRGWSLISERRKKKKKEEKLLTTRVEE